MYLIVAMDNPLHRTEPDKPVRRLPLLMSGGPPDKI